MQSNSPSGKYRCVVTEQLPPAGYYSPHLYTFTIRDALTNRDLKGESYRRDTDSVSLTDLKFVWFDDELTVSLPTQPPRPFSQLNFITVNSNGLRLEIDLDIQKTGSVSARLLQSNESDYVAGTFLPFLLSCNNLRLPLSFGVYKTVKIDTRESCMQEYLPQKDQLHSQHSTGLLRTSSHHQEGSHRARCHEYKKR